MPQGVPRSRLFLLTSTPRAAAAPARDGGFRSCNGFSRRSGPLSLVVSGSRGSALLTCVVEIMATPSSLASPTQDPGPPKTGDPTPLRAVHTTNFPALLRQLGASLLVTDHPRVVDAPLAAVVRRPALGLRVGREKGSSLNSAFLTP